ncbi:hypothetical protein [Micromonospora craniellae]|nr:hypothetical protein [Micromonospora craniellae]QOC93561.1 hypothetical protein ID554_07955 [Micromonospora craniellae]
MSVRRHTGRLATLCVFLGGLVVLGGVPAHADEDRVRVRASSSFTAGRSAQGVTVEVRKRTDGCVRVRGALGLSLPGVRADQVAVQANVGGRWVPVSVSGDVGLLATAPVAPARDELCERRGVALRYRVTFAADVPDGRLVVTGEASTARGALLGRVAVASRVVGGRVAPSPSPSRSRSASPSPTPSASTAPGLTVAATPRVALAADGTTDPVQTANQSSGGSPVMYFGIGMVALGALLIGLLIVRSRKDRRQRREGAGIPLPRNPGGTTYRSGASHVAASVPPGPGAPPPAPPGRGVPPMPPSPVPPASPGQVYGTARPATPRVYGAPASPRPSGGLYGARPEPGHQPRTTPPAARASAVPPVSAPPAVPPVSAPPAVPPVSAPPVGPPVSAPPVAPTSGQPGAGAVPGQPDGGDRDEPGRGLSG